MNLINDAVKFNSYAEELCSLYYNDLEFITAIGFPTW